MKIILESFGFRYGKIRKEYNKVIDCQHLSNPPEYLMVLGSGKTKPVANWLSKRPDIQKLIKQVSKKFIDNKKHVESVYKVYFLGIGCVGGMHRSVYIVEKLGSILKAAGFDVVINHRRLNKN